MYQEQRQDGMRLQGSRCGSLNGKERKMKMGLIDRIKQDAQKSGGSKGKFIFFRDGDKKRVRFLSDMEDGLEVIFHDNFEEGVNVPCQEIFGRDCKYCDMEGLRTRSQYVWSVWDYENKDVKILMYPMNNCSPLGAIAAMYETYGTLLDRDFVISVSGKQSNKQFSVVPMDKNKFRNEKAKPFSKKALLDILDKAYPDENRNDEDEKPKSKSSKKDDVDYSEMTARELYKLCEERDIEAEPKMKEKYYINLLKEYDDENESSDDWEEDDSEEMNYSEMSVKELYNLCQDRDIDVLPKKSEKYYINALKEYDKAHDDWEDSDDEDEDDW